MCIAPIARLITPPRAVFRKLDVSEAGIESGDRTDSLESFGWREFTVIYLGSPENRQGAWRLLVASRRKAEPGGDTTGKVRQKMFRGGLTLFKQTRSLVDLTRRSVKNQLLPLGNHNKSSATKPPRHSLHKSDYRRQYPTDHTAITITTRRISCGCLPRTEVRQRTVKNNIPASERASLRA